jgi:hypothetical protein
MTRSLLGPCDSSARNGAAHSARRDSGRWPDDSQRVFRYSAVYLVIFVFTAGVNQYYGYDGYMPLDQSMIYNGAWWLLSGQTPYVDFWTPYGTIPILVQAGIFRAFGVSWTNYVLQASLMTRFFATCVMFAGLRLGLTLSVAALFGAIACVIAYPPMSTPYVDNHAAIVSSLLVLGIVLGIMDADKRPMWWLLAPPLAIVAFLCKQSPTLFVVAFYGVAIFFTAWHQGAICDLIYVPFASVLCSLVTVLVAPALFWHPSCPFQWMAARAGNL